MNAVLQGKPPSSQMWFSDVCEREKNKVLFQTMHSSVFWVISAVYCDFACWDTLGGLAPDLGFLSTQQNLYEQYEFDNN